MPTKLGIDHSNLSFASNHFLPKLWLENATYRTCKLKCSPGPGCSKLQMSLINILLKFQMLIFEICQDIFFFFKCEKLLQNLHSVFQQTRAPHAGANAGLQQLLENFKSKKGHNCVKET